MAWICAVIALFGFNVFDRIMLQLHLRFDQASVLRCDQLNGLGMRDFSRLLWSQRSSPMVMIGDAYHR